MITVIFISSVIMMRTNVPSAVLPVNCAVSWWWKNSLCTFHCHCLIKYNDPPRHWNIWFIFSKFGGALVIEMPNICSSCKAIREKGFFYSVKGIVWNTCCSAKPKLGVNPGQSTRKVVNTRITPSLHQVNTRFHTKYWGGERENTRVFTYFWQLVSCGVD